MNQSFKHCKAIAVDKQALELLKMTYFGRNLPSEFTKGNSVTEGVIVSENASELAEWLAQQ